VNEKESSLLKFYKKAVLLSENEFDVFCNVLMTEAFGVYTENFIEIVTRKRKQITMKESAP